MVCKLKVRHSRPRPFIQYLGLLRRISKGLFYTARARWSEPHKEIKKRNFIFSNAARTHTKKTCSCSNDELRNWKKNTHIQKRSRTENKNQFTFRSILIISVIIEMWARVCVRDSNCIPRARSVDASCKIPSMYTNTYTLTNTINDEKKLYIRLTIFPQKL